MATKKQELAAKLLVENSRNPVKTTGNILREVGYSEATAIKPSQVTESKGFQELLEKYMPDDYLFDNHKAIIDSNRGDPNITKTLELAYKLKRKLKDQDTGGQPLQSLIQININK